MSHTLLSWQEDFSMSECGQTSVVTEKKKSPGYSSSPSNVTLCMYPQAGWAGLYDKVKKHPWFVDIFGCALS